jgi:hypothetical protein
MHVNAKVIPLMLAIAASSGSARGDDEPPDHVDGAVRVGVAAVGFTNPNINSPYVTDPGTGGLGGFVDGEVGFRHGAWTYALFGSYLLSHDSVDNVTEISSLTFDVFELGARFTRHFGRASAGFGVMPYVGVLQRGTYGNGSMTSSVNLSSNLYGVEAHAGVDVAQLLGHPVQLFALYEFTFGDGPNDDSNLVVWSSARVGVGMTF